MTSLLSVALNSAAVYVCIVLFIRIFGKKELSQLSVIDLVFILLISNSVQNAMVGNNATLAGGLIAALSLFLINTLMRFFVYKFKPVQKFIEGEPIILIYKGKAILKHLAHEKITLEELDATVREHGIEMVSQVDLAVLEVDGNISVLAKSFTHQSNKKRRAHRSLNLNQ
jgi:uncharacterized membrane protein YcaP (DUF421 family)